MPSLSVGEQVPEAYFSKLLSLAENSKICPDLSSRLTSAICGRWQNKSRALVCMFLPNSRLLKQMKVGPVKGFKRFAKASNVLSEINTSDLKPDT